MKKKWWDFKLTPDNSNDNKSDNDQWMLKWVDEILRRHEIFNSLKVTKYLLIKVKYSAL